MSQADTTQTSELKKLLALGKARGYLTYAEINDHLSSDVGTEQIEDIVSMINDMGINVFDNPPDADELLLSEDNVSEESVEDAAAVLSAVDTEGRTTDPVRMYMREMGTVELLTRQGEIEIAKRIDDGLGQVLVALSEFPATAGRVLAIYTDVEAEQTRLADLMSGFVDPSEEKLKSEFSGVKRSYIPLQAIIRIDEVDKEGISKVSDASSSEGNVSSFPFSGVVPGQQQGDE